MSLFVETSALVAIILEEEGWEVLAGKIDATDKPVSTSVACFETICAIAQRKQISPSQAHEIVMATVEIAGITISGFSSEMLEHAVRAGELYGKGHHKAGLNMGDCLSYAAASHYQIPLLFAGDDFVHTDLPSA